MNFRSEGIQLNGVRSNGVSVEWPFGQMVFGQTALGQEISVKRVFGKVIQNRKVFTRPTSASDNKCAFYLPNMKYERINGENFTVEIFSGEPSKSAQLRFTLKIRFSVFNKHKIL
jgi:hypothetical protein